MKRNLEEKEKERESVNEAMGISDTWKDTTLDFIVDEIAASERVSDVIETLLHDIKEEEFGEGKYELTTYEKKKPIRLQIESDEPVKPTNKNANKKIVIEDLSKSPIRTANPIFFTFISLPNALNL